MFLAQNVAGGSQQQFPSRDQLLGFLEQENGSDLDAGNGSRRNPAEEAD